ncbi:MAG: sulfatase-like hydrolase/transferase [Bacteroidota bacterium]
MNSNHNLKKIKIFLPYLVFFIPALVLLVAGYFYSGMDFYRLKFILAEAGIFSLGVLLSIVILPLGKVKRYFYYIGYLIIAISVFIQLSYFKMFGDKIGASTVFIVLETNMAETSEFLSAYFTFFNLIILLILFLPFLVIKYFPVSTCKSSFSKLILFSLIGVLIFSYQSKALAAHNLYNVAWNSYEEYKEQTGLYEKYGLDKPMGAFQKVSMLDSSENQTFVMVIGESTTRHRMGLYGYPRQTTPLLSGLKDELVVFKDVISPHTHTMTSLSKIMSLNNYENEERLREGSIIQLMNQAGFKTFWISNQKPIGWNESLISVMAKAADESYFPNPGAEWQQPSLDEDLLPLFQKVLKNKAPKKFIIVHLLGTHVEYFKRYPESYKLFSGKPPYTISHSPKDLQLINEYDNAIAYNDRVLYDFIKALKKKEEKSWLLFFSDHGEDVFQVNNFFGHTESKGTYPMYDVPFILWLPESFAEKNKFKFELKRPYMLDDLIYSVSDLTGVYFKGFEPERSIFNDSFAPRNRLIYEGKDYDSIFN